MCGTQKLIPKIVEKRSTTSTSMFCCSHWNMTIMTIVLVVYMKNWRVELHQRSYAGWRLGHSEAESEKSWSQFVSKISWSSAGKVEIALSMARSTSTLS